MASGRKAVEDTADRDSSIWVLDQQLDQPMEEEARRIRNAYQEKALSINVPYKCGTFALYSLLCRHAKIGTIPNHDHSDEKLTTYSCSKYREQSFAAKTKRWLEGHRVKKHAILVLVLVGSCMVIGDGILTPAISVLSAVGGINVGRTKISNGTEALFADLSHFPVSSIQIAFTVVVFPCLLLAYSGQAAYLMKNPNYVAGAFYHSIPAGFKNQSQIGNASGTAVIIVMLVTTCLMTLIMILVWHSHWALVLLFTWLSLLVEGFYLSSVIQKVYQGGWVPLVIATAFFIIMYTWHYGTAKRYEIEMHTKVSMAWILSLGPSLGLVRVPGIGLVYTELASGVPHIFSHFITNLPAIHSVVVFVCLKCLPVCTIPEEERFLVKRIGPKNFRMFRCVARYGYKDLHKKDDDFEKKLFDSLFLFVRLESLMDGGSSDSDVSSLLDPQNETVTEFPLNTLNSTCSSMEFTNLRTADSIQLANSPLNQNQIMVPSNQANHPTEIDELEFLVSCKNVGVVHILGNTVMTARRDSSLFKKIAIDYVYAFLRKICRENSAMFNIPHESLLNVGQTFYV
ncbi:Potassium transporter 11, partial [Cucurbita argyrosperma subsp. argyrosperma]